MHKGKFLGFVLWSESAEVFSLGYFCIKSCLEPSENPLTTVVYCNISSSHSLLHHFPSILCLRERVCAHVSVHVMRVPKLRYHGELFGKGTLWTISAEDIKMHFKNQSSSYVHRSRLEGHIKDLVTVVASGEGNWGIDQGGEGD